MRVPVFAWARPGSRPFRRKPRQSVRPPAAAAAVTAAAVTAALLAAPAAQAAPAAVQGHPGTPPAAGASSRPTPADAETLASRQARRTGKPVTVPSLTTSVSQTQALPSGGFKLTTSANPVRAWARGGWQPLSAALRRNSDGTWSPAVSAAPVTVSGGGTGPMAALAVPGRSLSLYWPGRLPAPAVSGNTAVYRSVLPGVDLRLTVSDEGSVSDVLVIRNRAAAKNPALRRLALTTQTTGGLQVTAGLAGTLQASAIKSGAPAFTSPAPVMWDSATDAAGPAPAAGAAAVIPSAMRATLPAASGPLQPGRHARAARVQTALSAPQRTRGGASRQSLALIPDAAMLASPATVFPAYVDPTWLTSGGSRGWYASDSDALPNNNYYDNTYDPSPGYLQVGYSGSFNAHSFFDMKTVSSQLTGATINSATLQVTEETSWSCTASPVELWWAGWYPTVNSKPWVSWNNEPSWNKWSGTGALSDGAITSQNVAHGYSSSCPAGAVDFNLTAFMQAKGPAGPSNLAFGLKAPNTGDSSQWKEFSNAAGAITMTTYYDHKPSPQAGSLISPGGACQSVSPAKTVNGQLRVAAGGQKKGLFREFCGPVTLGAS